jgi:hypothetical protein
VVEYNITDSPFTLTYSKNFVLDTGGHRRGVASFESGGVTTLIFVGNNATFQNKFATVNPANVSTGTTINSLTDLYYTNNFGPSRPPCGAQNNVIGLVVTNTTPRKMIALQSCPGSPINHYLTQFNYSNGVIDDYINITSYYSSSPLSLSYYNGNYYILYSDETLLAIQAGNSSNYSIVGTLPIPYQGANSPWPSLGVIYNEVDQNLF